MWAGTHGKVIAEATQYSAPLTFAAAHPDIVAIAQKDTTQIANAQKFAPELAVIQAHPALFTQAAKFPANKVPPRSRLSSLPQPAAAPRPLAS